MPGVGEEKMDRFASLLFFVALPALRKRHAERMMEDLGPDRLAAEQVADHPGRRFHVRDDPLARLRFEECLEDREIRRLGNAQVTRSAVLDEWIEQHRGIFDLN